MLTRTYTISCDGPDCSTDPIVVERGISDPPDGPGAVMAAARAAGWHRFKRDKHACPEHTAWLNDHAGDPLYWNQPAGEVARGYRGMPIEGVSVHEAAEGVTRFGESVKAAADDLTGALARARVARREAGT